MNKKLSRLRRARKTRSHIKYLRVTRLCINRTPRHIYAQIIDATGGTVLASASTLDKELRASLKTTGNVEAAAIVGKAVAERARVQTFPADFSFNVSKTNANTMIGNAVPVNMAALIGRALREFAAGADLTK